MTTTTTAATLRVDRVGAEDAAGGRRRGKRIAIRGRSILTALQKTSVCHIQFPDVKALPPGDR